MGQRQEEFLLVGNRRIEFGDRKLKNGNRNKKMQNKKRFEIYGSSFFLAFNQIHFY